MFYFAFTATNQENLEFLVMETEREVFDAVSDSVESILYCLNPDFIAYYIDFDDFENGTCSISMAQDLGEGINPLLKASIHDWDGFIKDAIRFDGPGTFLSKDEEELSFNGFCTFFGVAPLKLKELLAQAKGTEIGNVASLRFYQQ